MNFSPKVLFRTFATAEMFTWAGLITAMVLRGMDVTNIVPIAGGIHGFVFLCYSVTTVFTWVNQKWRFTTGASGLALAIVPFATVPFELWAERRGLLEGVWRLGPGGDEPVGFVEKSQAWVLRNPLLAIAIGLIAVAVVFSVLLWLGPPPVPGR